MKIFGISGKARSGKDTLAKMLLAEAHEGIHMSFAEPIRAFVADLLGVPVDLLQDSAWKEQPLPQLNGKSPRVLMQTLGTEWGRETIDPDLWIKVAQWRLERLSSDLVPPKVVVFSDVRFDNEADMIRSVGGTIVHVIRPGAEVVAAHASENGIRRDLTDWTCMNDGSLLDLRAFAKMALSQCR